MAAAEGGCAIAGWLVVGAAGALGGEVMRALAAAGHEATGLDRTGLDLRDGAAIDAAVHQARPRVVVNCAAYTAVDDAETDEATAHAVNAVAPGRLAAACRDVGARLVHLSTDYVFAGDGSTPYDEETAVQPRSVYGRTKAAGERAVLTSGAAAYVVRTAWLYGVSGTNFVRTMARLAGERDTVDVVTDQVGSPTWNRVVAEGIVALAGADVEPGIWHCACTGEVSWHGFAQAIYAGLGLDPARVRPTTSAAFVRPAPRPAYSALSTRKWHAAGLPTLPHWRDALRDALPHLGG